MADKKSLGHEFTKGIIKENPVLVLVLGTCPAIATSTTVLNALGMGLAATFVLLGSNIVISLLRKIIPNKVRIPCFIVVIAGFVSVVQLLLQAYAKDLYNSLGIFLPLIVVNCIILGRAEAFSYKNGVAASFFDGIFQGLGYTIVLTIMCIIREFLGSGSFGKGLINTVNGVIGNGDGLQIFSSDLGAKILTMPFGGFLTLGVLIAVMQYALKKSADKKAKKEAEK